MKKLYVIRVEWSQTEHQWLGVYAESSGAAISKIETLYPGAYYYSIGARVDKIIE